MIELSHTVDVYKALRAPELMALCCRGVVKWASPVELISARDCYLYHP